MKKGVITFTLPGEESLLNNLLNKEGVEIVDKTIVPCPKEGYILYLIEYEDHELNT